MIPVRSFIFAEMISGILNIIEKKENYKAYKAYFIPFFKNQNLESSKLLNNWIIRETWLKCENTKSLNFQTKNRSVNKYIQRPKNKIKNLILCNFRLSKLKMIISKLNTIHFSKKDLELPIILDDQFPLLSFIILNQFRFDYEINKGRKMIQLNSLDKQYIQSKSNSMLCFNSNF